ncbi:hypothetical protein CCP1ISM_90020 [Azospirillaceae bacterium]
MEYADALNNIGKMVKSFANGFKHGVPAKLISISNKTTCIIKPVGHKKTEKVLLSDIVDWKSRNADTVTNVVEKEISESLKDDFYDHLIETDRATNWCNNNYFPILRFKQGDETIKAKLFKCGCDSLSLILDDGTVVNDLNNLAFYEEDQKMPVENDTEFVIVDSVTKMFWGGGGKRWVKELVNVLKYSNQYGRSACTKILKHSPNAELIGLSSIHDLVGSWNNETPIASGPPVEPEPEPVPVPVSTPEPVPAPEPKPVVSQPDDKLLEYKMLLEQAYRDKLAADEMSIEAQGRINKLTCEMNIHKLMSL